MEIGQRHFGSRHQIQVPVAGDLEQVLLELREVSRAVQRRAVGQIRRHDFAIPVLAGVQVEHEVDQRARHSGAGAAQHREARRRDLRAALEVDDAERRSEIPVRNRREIEGAWLDRGAGPPRCRPRSCQPARTACGRFGRTMTAASRWCSMESSCSPICLICCARARFASCTGAVSFPWRFARAISSPDVFCWRFSPSSSGMIRRRAVSSVAISSSALSGSRPRLRRPLRTSSM